MCGECLNVFKVLIVDCSRLLVLVLVLVRGENSRQLPAWITSFSEFTISLLLSPDQVLLVGHAGRAGTKRNVAILIPGEAVLGDAVVSVGEEAGRAAAGAGAAPARR